MIFSVDSPLSPRVHNSLTLSLLAQQCTCFTNPSHLRPSGGPSSRSRTRTGPSVLFFVCTCLAITFRVSLVDDAQCIVVTCVCVCLCDCLSVRSRMPTLLHGPGCNLETGRGCPLVVHYWADLQSVHGLRCYGNITQTRNVSEYMLMAALCNIWPL